MHHCRKLDNNEVGAIKWSNWSFKTFRLKLLSDAIELRHEPQAAVHQTRGSRSSARAWWLQNVRHVATARCPLSSTRSISKKKSLGNPSHFQPPYTSFHPNEIAAAFAYFSSSGSSSSVAAQRIFSACQRAAFHIHYNNKLIKIHFASCNIKFKRTKTKAATMREAAACRYCLGVVEHHSCGGGCALQPKIECHHPAHRGNILYKSTSSGGGGCAVMR